LDIVDTNDSFILRNHYYKIFYTVKNSFITKKIMFKFLVVYKVLVVYFYLNEFIAYSFKTL